MFDKVAGISLSGGYFTPECTLTPFALTTWRQTPQPVHISVIYGKNGCGKTSFSHGFYEYAQTLNIYNSVNLIDHDENNLTENDIDKSNIFVFNEEYIRKNIRFADDGLESVVMLGEQVELDEQINNLNENKLQLENEIRLLSEEYSKYEISTDILSSKFYLIEIKTNLRQNWAEREREIRSLRQNASVSDEFLNTLYYDDKVIDIIKLMEDYENKIAQLRAVKSGECINDQVTLVLENSVIDSCLLTNFKKEISEVALSEREQQVMQVVKHYSDGEAILQRSKKFFLHGDSNCPFCLQETTQEYRNDLIEAITRVFETDEATKHKEDLDAIPLNLINIDLSKFKPINSDLCEEIMEDILRYNNQIEEAKNKVKQKLLSIYTPIECNSFGFFTMQQSINLKLRKLERERNAYNSRIESINALINELSDCNRKYAREEVRDSYEKYTRQKNIEANQLEILNIKKQNLQEILKQIEELNARKRNTHIAVEIINEYLIVLDDPISSFDFDNKIGLYSFLRYTLGNICSGNSKSRCLIMTHDIEVMFSMKKICADLSVHSMFYELKNKKLWPFISNKYNEYSNMLQRIFAYANQEDGYQEMSDIIGNTMRRVLEAFGTFTYKKGIDKLSIDHEILGTIQEETKRNYFRNLMYRLVLNGESHLQERTQGIPDTNFYLYISEEEKSRTARDILVFINLLNPLHLKEHLKVVKNKDVKIKVSKISLWEKEIFSI